jgi:predicted MFS family arabinose efflux permease
MHTQCIEKLIRVVNKCPICKSQIEKGKITKNYKLYISDLIEYYTFKDLFITITSVLSGIADIFTEQIIGQISNDNQALYFIMIMLFTMVYITIMYLIFVFEILLNIIVIPICLMSSLFVKLQVLPNTLCKTEPSESYTIHTI